MIKLAVERIKISVTSAFNFPVGSKFLDVFMFDGSPCVQVQLSDNKDYEAIEVKAIKDYVPLTDDWKYLGTIIDDRQYHTFVWRNTPRQRQIVEWIHGELTVTKIN